MTAILCVLLFADTPHERRASREAAVASALNTSDRKNIRLMVESEYGDLAVAALAGCTPDVRSLLAEAHADGKLARLRPRELLPVIARHGDEVCRFALSHEELATDSYAMTAFLEDPWPYTLKLESLEAGAQKVRARSFGMQTVKNLDWRGIAIGAVGAALVVCAIRMRKRRP